MSKNLKRLVEKSPPKNGRFYCIAIDGRGGSGKTTFATYLHNLMSGYELLNGDEYFEPETNTIAWGAFNDARFVKEIIKPLQTTNNIVYHSYDWDTKPHLKTKELKIDSGLILERCYSFKFELIWDLRIWVETSRELCLERGVAREHLPIRTVLRTWQEVWQPEEDRYINNFKPQQQADLVIDGTKPFELQLR